MIMSNHIQLKPEHLYVIETLAEETNRPVEEVKQLYAETLVLLGSDARVKDYLIVLTSKKVRDLLRYTREPALT
jgi:uncharacterized protein DUF3562